MSFSHGSEDSWVLNNATGFRKIHIVAGYTDLCFGIDGLASIVKFNFQLAPYEERSTGNHTGTMPGVDAGAGDCLHDYSGAL